MRRAFVLTAVLAIVAIVVDHSSARPGGGKAGGGGGGRAGGAGPGAGDHGGSRGPSGAGNVGDRGGAGFQGGNFDKGPGNLGANGGFNGNNTPGGKFNSLSSDQVKNFLGGDSRDNRGDTRGDRATQAQQQWQGSAHQVRTNAQQWANSLFTPAWYAQHPNAWQATHPHADAWAVASVTAVTTWVAATATSAAPVYTTDGGTTTTEETPVSSQPTNTNTTTNTADDPSQWLPLGVFAVAPQTQTEANQVLQLAVNKQGTLKGSYYDVLSESGQPVVGSVNPKTHDVAWTVGNGKSAVFRSTIENLTQDEAPLLLTFGDGRHQKWTTIRLKGTKTGGNESGK